MDFDPDIAIEGVGFFDKEVEDVTARIGVPTQTFLTIVHCTYLEFPHGAQPFLLSVISFYFVTDGVTTARPSNTLSISVTLSESVVIISKS